MTYPTQSQQPSAAPGRVNVGGEDLTDAPLPDDHGWGGPRPDASPDQQMDTSLVDGAGSQSTDPRTDREEPARSPSDGQLSPGASADDPVAALWGTDLVQRYRAQWQQLQLRFVDDPRGATGEAAQLLDDAVHSLTTTLADQKQTLDGWQSAQGEDTEVLRTALTRYRDFLDRLLGL